MQRHGPSQLEGPLSRRSRLLAGGSGASDRSAPSQLTEAQRQARIERIRREIAEGTYDTPEKLAIALEKLLRKLELG